MLDFFIVLKYLALAYGVYFLVKMTRDAVINISFISFVWKRVRSKMIAEAFGVLFLVASSFVLLSLFVPITRLGWMNFFIAEGGNIILTPIAGLTETHTDFVRYVPVALLIVLLFIAPFFVQVEEEMFRHGHTSKGGMILWSVIFGLAHLVLGIPLAAGISLIILGLFLGYKYRKAYWETVPFCGEELNIAYSRAIATSIVYHTLFDSMLFVILLAKVVYSLI
jgi:hypothetical protein